MNDEVELELFDLGDATVETREQAGGIKPDDNVEYGRDLLG